MKLEMQMTDRDKKLLIFLAIFVIVVGIGYWGVYPQIKAINEINEEIQYQENKMFLDDMKITELPFLEDENDELEDEIIDARAHFYPVMTNDEVDKMLTFMVLDYKLQSYDLGITSSSTEAKLSAYQYSQKYLDDMYESVDSVYESESNGFDDFYEPAPTGVYCVAVSMRLGGAQDDLQKLIDDLSVTTETMHLVRYDWHFGQNVVYDDKLEDFVVEDDVQLTIQLNIYVCSEKQ